MHVRRTLVVALLCAACRKDAPTTQTTHGSAATSAPAPASEGAKETRFTKVAPAVGAKREETSDLTMSMAMNVAMEGKAQEVDLTVTESVKRVDEVLATDGDAVTKVKVRFDAVTSTRREGGQQKTQPSAIAGKTYVVEAREGVLDVRDENGNAVSTDERKEAAKHFKNLGKPDPMLGALPPTPLVPGQRVDALANAIRVQMRESGENMEARDVVVTFREQRGDEGVFDVAMKIAKNEGPMAMQMDMRGETWISAKTGWPTKMTLEGPLTIATAKTAASTMKADGSGKMSMSMTARAL